VKSNKLHQVDRAFIDFIQYNKNIPNFSGEDLKNYEIGRPFSRHGPSWKNESIPHSISSSSNDLVKYFIDTAKAQKLVSDKVFLHGYHYQYGTYLLPFIHKKHAEGKKVKMLEIGLGCTMIYGRKFQYSSILS
jgi:hypothetical protein